MYREEKGFTNQINILVCLCFSGDVKAQGYTIATGKAMALTVLDILTKDGVMEKIKDEFNTTIQAKLNGGV